MDEADADAVVAEAEFIDLIEKWGLSFNSGVAVTHIVRANFTTDLRQAKHLHRANCHLDREINAKLSSFRRSGRGRAQNFSPERFPSH